MTEEKLLEFLYVAPVALIEFDGRGKVKIANPRVAQLFNRFAPGGYFDNFFTFPRRCVARAKRGYFSVQ